MKRISLLGVCLMLVVTSKAQKIEKVTFGDFEQWAVRYIKDSRLLGGKTHALYAIAPTDTIRENAVFVYGKNGNPWSVSNAYAVVAGIEKGSGTVSPEYRDAEHGYCCRMDSKLETVTAFGVIDIKVLVAGTIFTGKTIEPIRTAKDPYQNIDFGVPFTKCPTAMVLDYKALISQENTLTYAKGMGRPKTIEGHDQGQLFCLLQKRWEDSEGNIHALRVGTAYERITKSQPVWQNDHEIPFYYGDITKQPYFKSYMGLASTMRAINSKGKIVPIIEEGWAPKGTKPTHMIINLTSGCYEAFVGHEGNTVWVDNIRLKY